MKHSRRRSRSKTSRRTVFAGWFTLSAAVSGCLSAAAPPVPMTNRLPAEPPIRVGVIVGAPHVAIGASGGVIMSTRGVGNTVLRTAVSVTYASGAVAVEGARAGSAGSVEFKAARRGEYVTVNGTAYRGYIEVVALDGALNVINVADIEEYLLSVVGSELWSRNETDLAALQAQAVAARTYALSNAGRYRDSGFDLRADVSDQAYRGVVSENGVAARAVRSTRGEVIVYDRELITAFYHSTCGPRTAAPEEAFRTIRSQPYLRPVSDGRPDRGFYNDLSPHFHWTVEWSGEELRRVLAATLPAELGIDPGAVTEIHDIEISRTGPSGRVTELHIVGRSGTVPVFGPDIRSVLRAPSNEPLRSTDFTLEVEHDGAGVSQVVARGSGLGHGVGLCQWGAVGRSRSGQDYRTIIETYYPGASIERWY